LATGDGGDMNNSKVFRILITIIIGVFGVAITLASADSQGDKISKPPEVIQGGIWYDHFYNPQMVYGKNIDVQMSRLLLKLDEELHWIQTWTTHFATGYFYHTEAFSDSVRLAPSGMGHFYTTGIYTSTVFDAGKAVDWSSTGWRYSGIPPGLEIKFRTGNTPMPDETWTAWELPIKGFIEYYCEYTFNSDETECLSNMSGFESSPYIQYRAAFSSEVSTKTVELYDIDFQYGTHPFTGTAYSMIIPPVDLLEWDSIIITSTIPTSTKLTIDVLANDGTELANDVQNGASLSEIDPIKNPALQLRAIFTTPDQSLTPDIDMWGIKWSIMHKLYLPVIFR
jgi:hypothetical protein